MRSVGAAALMAGLVAVPALAQAPALTTDQMKTALSQDDCVKRARAVMENAGLPRIAVVGQSVFADSRSRREQVAIRCLADQGVVLFVAAGGGGDERVTAELALMLRQAFEKAG
jgi:hypothetical protein